MNEAWTELKQACSQCRRCGLGETRHHLVFGDGAEDARIMLIGETVPSSMSSVSIRLTNWSSMPASP